MPRLTTGVDAEVRQNKPNESYFGKPIPFLSGTSNQQKRILVKFPGLVEQVRGRTVVSARLSGRLRVGGNHTVEIARLVKTFGAQTKWSNQPATTGTVISQASTVASGGRWSIDVSALVQHAATNGVHYGWRLSSPVNADRSYYGFESGAGDAWVLDITLVPDGDAPVSLEPDGGVVGLPKVVLTWEVDAAPADDSADGGDGTDAEQIAYQVQIDRPATGQTPDPAAPDYDSGEVTSIEAQHPMGDAAYNLTSGALTFWRVRTKDASLAWTDWSDWAEMTYRPYPAITWISPALNGGAGTLTDPSPVVQLSTPAAPEAFRIIVATVLDPITPRFDSLAIEPDGATFGLTVPTKVGERVVFAEDVQHRIEARVYDRDDRVATPGDPGYAVAVALVSYASSADAAPTSLAASQPIGHRPRVRLRWTRGAAADGWVIERDGRVIENLDHAAVTPDGAGAWRWDDDTSTPGRLHEYRVRAVTNGAQTGRSPAASIAAVVKGFWLIRDNGDAVCLAGDYNDLLQSDRRVTYEPVGSQATIDIIQAQLGIGGEFDGALYKRYDAGNDAGLTADLAVMRAIRAAPLEPVRAVYAETNIRVLLADVSVTGHGQYRANTRMHRIRFRCWQVSGFETTR